MKFKDCPFCGGTGRLPENEVAAYANVVGKKTYEPDPKPLKKGKKK